MCVCLICRNSVTLWISFLSYFTLFLGPFYGLTYSSFTLTTAKPLLCAALPLDLSRPPGVPPLSAATVVPHVHQHTCPAKACARASLGCIDPCHCWLTACVSLRSQSCRTALQNGCGCSHFCSHWCPPRHGVSF